MKYLVLLFLSLNILAESDSVPSIELIEKQTPIHRSFLMSKLSLLTQLKDKSNQEAMDTVVSVHKELSSYFSKYSAYMDDELSLDYIIVTKTYLRVIPTKEIYQKDDCRTYWGEFNLALNGDVNLMTVGSKETLEVLKKICPAE